MNAIVQSRWAQSIWRDLKLWRVIPLGPVNFVFKFARGHRRTRPEAFVGLSPSGISRISKRPEEIEQTPCTPGSAVIVGVGPGLGEALAVGIAKRGLPLALVSRSAPALESLASRL